MSTLEMTLIARPSYSSQATISGGTGISTPCRKGCRDDEPLIYRGKPDKRMSDIDIDDLVDFYLAGRGPLRVRSEAELDEVADDSQ